MNTGQKSPDRRHLRTGAATSDEPDEPFPPRYWWLKRILAGVGLLLVGLVLLRLVWGWEANRRLQAEIDSYIAAGEPIYPEDFDPAEDIPDDQNAAKFLIDAAAAVTLTPQQVELISKALDAVEAVRADADALTALVEANAQALSLARRAGELNRFDWRFRLRSPLLNLSIQPLGFGSQRLLGRLLCVASLSLAECGKHAEALDTLRDALAHAHIVGSGPTTANYLFGGSYRDLTITCSERFAPVLLLNSGSPLETENQSARQASARALIAALLDEDMFQASFVRGMFFLRCYYFDIARCVLNDSFSIGQWGSLRPAPSSSWPEWCKMRFSTPVLKMDLLTLMEKPTRYARATSEPSRLRALATQVPAFYAPARNGSPLRALTEAIEPTDLLPIARGHVVSLARSRMAAVSLAIRLYEFDHDRRPGALAELVPEYLDAVPLDPFTLNDKLRYLIRDDGAILYSVGFDGIDNRGAAPRRANGVIDRSHGVIIFYLDGRQRENDNAPADPSPEAGNDEEDDGRQEADPGKDNRAEKSP